MASEKDAEQQVKNKFNQALEKIRGGFSGIVSGAEDFGRAVGEAIRRTQQEQEEAQRLALAAAKLTLTGKEKISSQEAGQALKNPLDSSIKESYERVHQLRVSPPVDQSNENDQGYKGPGL